MEQEQRATPCRQRRKQRGCGEKAAQSSDSERDQKKVAEAADQRHQKQVFALQALSQHKRILRPNGDDQARTRPEALQQQRQWRISQLLTPQMLKDDG
jgi:hypothetical protein